VKFEAEKTPEGRVLRELALLLPGEDPVEVLIVADRAVGGVGLREASSRPDPKAPRRRADARCTDRIL
jgi:hypothetical protein